MAEDHKATVIDNGGFYSFPNPQPKVKMEPGKYYPGYSNSHGFILHKNKRRTVREKVEEKAAHIHSKLENSSTQESQGPVLREKGQPEDTSDTSDREDVFKEDYNSSKYFPMEKFNSGLGEADSSIKKFISNKEFFDRNNLDYKRSILLFSEPGCFSKGTQVLMYDGSTKSVEDVEVGDKLMGPDSTPRTVQQLKRGKEQMYWVRQNKGDDYRVNKSHILSLKRRKTDKSGYKDEILNIKIDNYLKENGNIKYKKYKGWRPENGITFEDCPNIKINPYFLGLWLGDGNREYTVVTTGDETIINYLELFAESRDMQISPYKHDKNVYAITNGAGSKVENNLMTDLRLYNLLYNKHIPHSYLTNTRDNRLKLLAGLVDSDGYVDNNSNYIEIAQKREHLANEIKFLALSLGLRSTISEKEVNGKTYYIINISGDLTKIPVKIDRKKANNIPNHTFDRTGITLEKDVVDNYYGFTVDKDNLFLLKDFTVVHNTGKTWFIRNTADRLIEEENAIVINIDSHAHLDYISEGMQTIDRTLHNRLKVIVIEELAEFCRDSSSKTKTLQLLDSPFFRENMLFLVTTNEPGSIPQNLIDRPSRLDVLAHISVDSFSDDFIPKWYKHNTGKELDDKVKEQSWYIDAKSSLTPVYWAELFKFSELQQISLKEAWKNIKERKELIGSAFSAKDAVGF